MLVAVQLEQERHAEAERSNQAKEEVEHVHARLKQIEKDMKQLTTKQVGGAVYTSAFYEHINTVFVMPVCWHFDHVEPTT